MTQIDRSNKDEQHLTLLMHYLLVLRKHGKLSSQLPKRFLYEEAGKKAFYKPGTAAKLIRKLIKDDKAVIEAKKLAEETFNV
jgi:hypothetical protein